MPEFPNIYELYGDTSLLRIKNMMDAGRNPTPEELTTVLRAHYNGPLPQWFVDMIDKAMRGELKQARGRPKGDFMSAAYFAVACSKYRQYLAWLQKREQSLSGLKGWSAMRGKGWWQGPPHERAARMATSRWLKHMNWNSFLSRLALEERHATRVRRKLPPKGIVD